jgi:hypothetical protein
MIEPPATPAASLSKASMKGDSFGKEKLVVWKHAEQDDVAAALSVALRRRRKRGYVERTDLTAGKAVCVA